MSFEMRMSMRPELRQELAQQLVHRLELKLKFHVGNVEKQLLKLVEFPNVDFDDPRSRYHMEMLGEFVFKQQVEDRSLASEVLAAHGLTEDDLEKIVIESFDQEDISFDIGTKRNVDRAQMILADGRSVAVTLSFDKQGVNDPAASPSLREAAALKDVDVTKAWSVQRLYGSRDVVKRGRHRGFVVKEYLDGSMLGNYFEYPPPPDSPQAEQYRAIARATGQSFTNAIEQLGGVPHDANPLNLIVGEDADRNLLVRNCDVEAIERGPDSIKHEIRALGNALGPYASDFYAEIPAAYRPVRPPAETEDTGHA